MNISYRHERANVGYEVQFYDRFGNSHLVVCLETVEDLAMYLARRCWGQSLANWELRTLPEIYKDGEKWGIEHFDTGGIKWI